MYYMRRLYTPTVTVRRTYHDHDVVGDLLAFDFGVNKANGYITRLVVIDNNKSKRMPFRVYFFDEQPSTINDHDPFTPTASDMAKVICDIEVASDDYKTAGRRSYVNSFGHHLEFDLVGKEVFAYAVCLGGTPTYETAGDLTFKLGVYINE